MSVNKIQINDNAIFTTYQQQELYGCLWNTQPLAR